MKGISRKVTFILVGGVLVFCFGICGMVVRSASAQSPRRAEEAFKNIQVLKGIPEAELDPTMNFFSASLGVQCRYCHYEDDDKDHDPSKDTKAQKLIARKMIEMTAGINKNMFSDRLVVTCYSCHRGNPKPVGVPLIGSAASEAQRRPMSEGPIKTGASGGAPTLDDVVEKYIAALGGAEAVQKVSSRVAKGTVTDIKGDVIPIDIVAKGSDARIVTTHVQGGDSTITLSGTLNGDSTITVNGDSGWARIRNGAPREMRPEEVEAARLEDPMYFAGRLKKVFSQLRVEAETERIDGREVRIVVGRSQLSPSVKLYFDKESGMLSRLVYSTKSAVGPYITQVDYEDYHNADGLQVPFRWTVSQMRGLCFTYQISDLKRDVPIEETMFSKPSARTATAAK